MGEARSVVGDELERLEVFLPGRLPSPNDRPAHWAESRRPVRRWRDRAEQAVWAALIERRLRVTNPAAPKRVAFHVTVKRRWDPTNLRESAGIKGIIDGLVRAGVIDGDGPDCGHEFGEPTQAVGLPVGVRVTVTRRGATKPRA